MLDSENPLTIPYSRRTEQADDYHGILVPDPYRWLEDPDSEETKAWIEAQNKVTFSYLNSIPERQQIKQRLSQLWDYERFGIPFKKGDRYFYFKNDGLQNQKVLYTLTAMDAEPQVLLDPNQLSVDGTVALSGLAIGDDGKMMAYGLSTSGSDWQEWQVRDVETGEDLPDRLKWIKFSDFSWVGNNQGFFYSRYDEPNDKTKLEEVNYFQKLYYHQLGQPQSEDVLIYQRPDQKEWGFNGTVTEDGRYLIISVWRGTDPKNLVFYQDLSDSSAQVVELIDEFEADFSFIDNDGAVFWFRTDLDAPRSRVIAIDINNPARDQWRELIGEVAETLEGVGVLDNSFVVSYLKDAHTQIKIFDLSGAFIREVALPGIGSVDGFAGKRYDTETFYSFTNFVTPGTIYRYDMQTDESTIFRQPQVAFLSLIHI